MPRGVSFLNQVSVMPMQVKSLPNDLSKIKRSSKFFTKLLLLTRKVEKESRLTEQT